MTIDQFKSILSTVRDQHFPELKEIQIGVSTFRSDAYFLQVQPSARTMLKKPLKRVYNVELNLKLLQCPPSLEAMEAILVHELEHVVDFTEMPAFKLIGHGIRYGTSLKYKVSYERDTDRRVLKKKLHLGLIEYREWVYQWLTPAELAKKRKIYLTPEEIAADLP